MIPLLIGLRRAPAFAAALTTIGKAEMRFPGGQTMRPASLIQKACGPLTKLIIQFGRQVISIDQTQG